MRLFETYTVTGVANQTEYSQTITSTQAQHKFIVGVRLYVSAVNGNQVIANVDRDEIMAIDDHLVGQNENPSYSFWPLEFDLPIGAEFQFGIQCGGTAEDLTAVLEYELIGG